MVTSRYGPYWFTSKLKHFYLFNATTTTIFKFWVNTILSPTLGLHSAVRRCSIHSKSIVDTTLINLNSSNGDNESINISSSFKADGDERLLSISDSVSPLSVLASRHSTTPPVSGCANARQCCAGTSSAAQVTSSSVPMDTPEDRSPLFSNLTGTAESSEVINNIIKELTTNPLYVKLTQIINSNSNEEMLQTEELHSYDGNGTKEGVILREFTSPGIATEGNGALQSSTSAWLRSRGG